eukprot:UN24014
MLSRNRPMLPRMRYQDPMASGRYAYEPETTYGGKYANATHAKGYTTPGITAEDLNVLLYEKHLWNELSECRRALESFYSKESQIRHSKKFEDLDYSSTSSTDYSDYPPSSYKKPSKTQTPRSLPAVTERVDYNSDPSRTPERVFHQSTTRSQPSMTEADNYRDLDPKYFPHSYPSFKDNSRYAKKDGKPKKAGMHSPKKDGKRKRGRKPAQANRTDKKKKPTSKNKSNGNPKIEGLSSSYFVVLPRFSSKNSCERVIQKSAQPNNRKETNQSRRSWAFVPVNAESSHDMEFLERRTLICFTHNSLAMMFDSVLTGEDMIEGEHVLRITLEGVKQLKTVPKMFRLAFEKGVKITKFKLPRTMKTMKRKRQGFLVFVKVETQKEEDILKDIFVNLSGVNFKISSKPNPVKVLL